ncbi:hypothetical protein BS50DRAFT_410470 [Corynespora cassiicola Philippines]|uniref:Uncharacterized protein n=1 Tax=Corynespora cassiicola Philippines TaxID=1448308 RepID=A0A2T2NLE6_CORCC|nr:hypothetical protein BS50DRAFT_410470 [Corynespora cassiicola Philippines]
MRLVNVETLEIGFFHENNVPEYAILSHTWGDDEVSYQEMLWINKMRTMVEFVSSQGSQATQDGSRNDQPAFMLATLEIMVRGNWNPGRALPDTSETALMKRYGWAKIIKSAKEAKGLGYNHIWIDTCCIDKTSSAELQESINSMYGYYQRAAVCLVYLNDIERDGSQDLSDFFIHAYTTCRWATRGWTLQELIAPKAVRFYLKDWSYLGDKIDFLKELSSSSGIPVFILENGDLHEVSIAGRMAWARNRVTTRSEDLAYCLLGIFDIQMPLLYGEGDKAFIRLQEEILKTTDDYSIFAWTTDKCEKSTYRGLLARSPAEFICGVDRENVPSTLPIIPTPLGLRLQLEFLPDPLDRSRSLAMIRATNDMNQRLAIRIKCLDGADQCARVDAGSLVEIDDWPTGQLRTIYVRQKLSIPQSFFTPEMERIHLRRRHSAQWVPPVRVTGVYPPEQWDGESFELCIPEKIKEFLGVIKLRVESTAFQIILGFHRTSQYYWCKIVQRPWPASDAPDKDWQTSLSNAVPPELRKPMFKDELQHEDMFIIANSGIAINISMRAAMLGDNVGIQLLVDGLAKIR